jgi:hypothetical protein
VFQIVRARLTNKFATTGIGPPKKVLINEWTDYWDESEFEQQWQKCQWLSEQEDSSLETKETDIQRDEL